MKKTGEEVFSEFTTGTKHHLTTQISDIAPDVQKYIINLVFGDVYARAGLTKQEKTLTTITTLAAMGGCEAELNTHVNTALNVQVEPRKISDTLIQMLPYAGFPRVINAINVAKAVLEDRGVNYRVEGASEGEDDDTNGSTDK